MSTFQRVTVYGHLGADPEVRYTASGQPVCNFRVATSERWKSKDGEPQERTEWHRIVVWGNNAENCGQYLRKGQLALVDGRIQTREWEDQQGQKRYTTEIVADRVIFGPSANGERRENSGDGGRRDGGGRSNYERGGRDGPPPPLDDSDIPF